MSIRERLSGNEAIAVAMKQINPDVMGAFPITPSTEIPQYFSTYVDNGEVDTEFIAVESEHSAMSTCIGVQAAGCRAISATSSCGLIYICLLYTSGLFYSHGYWSCNTCNGSVAVQHSVHYLLHQRGLHDGH